MEGRAIARPNHPRRRARPSRAGSFNGGPSNCPAKLTTSNPSSTMKFLLQWRAEQLPGQTHRRCPQRRRPGPASMEGRAIARPNPPYFTPPETFITCFNGGPSNCPAKPPIQALRALSEQTASMEGRAIARPNGPSSSAERAQAQRASMEGRAIARPNFEKRRGRQLGWLLQWRAEQLPGQTRILGLVMQKRIQASMEGRAIARPNRGRSPRPQRGRPRLQWRAEQLPGQTGLRRFDESPHR